MAITYSWIFRDYDVAPLENNLQNVVKKIYWIYRGEENGKVFEVAGETSLPSPDPQNFTSFENITTQWSIDAITDVVDMAPYENVISSAISIQSTITTVKLIPPLILTYTPPLNLPIGGYSGGSGAGSAGSGGGGGGFDPGGGGGGQEN